MNRRHIITLVLASSTAAMPTPSVAAGPSAKPKPPKPVGSIQDRVCRIVSEHLGIPLQQIQPQSRFVADLKADSLDLVELVMAFEDEFGVEMNDSDCAGLTTIDKAVVYLQQLTAKKQEA
jgi:acyl carrier protein